MLVKLTSIRFLLEGRLCLWPSCTIFTATHGSSLLLLCFVALVQATSMTQMLPMRLVTRWYIVPCSVGVSALRLKFTNLITCMHACARYDGTCMLLEDKVHVRCNAILCILLAYYCVSWLPAIGYAAWAAVVKSPLQRETTQDVNTLTAYLTLHDYCSDGLKRCGSCISTA